MRQTPFSIIREPLSRFAALLGLLLALVLASTATPALAQQASRNVLVLYSDSRLLPGFYIIDETLDSVLKAELGANVELFNEFLGLDAARGNEYSDQLADFLRKKYADTKIDAIVAVRSPALKFALARRNELFPGVPIVHVATRTDELASMELPRDVVGVPIKLAPEKTIELALKLQPEIKRVVVITGTSTFDKGWESLLHKAFRPLESRVNVEFWSGLPMNEILAKVAKLPRDTIAYLPGLRQDGAGQRFVPQLIAADIVTASSVPVYGNNSNFREDGTIGGYIAPLDEVARQAAQLTVKLLRGEKSESLAPPAAVRNAYILNMTQLRRFGVDEANLPPDAILRYRQPSLWEAYHWQITALAGLLLLQAALIVALLVQRTIRRRAQAKLRESEQRMNVAAEATGVGMWLEDLSRHEFWASPQHRALLGMTQEEPYNFERFLSALHPEDRTHVREAIQGALAGGGKYDVSYRVPLPGGRVRWVDSRGRVELDSRGRPERIRGVTSDVTVRKEAELDAQRHRNELAHVSRVGMLGQLSGSLAHELNQPLTAILSNAQAALRFLDIEPADLDEVRDILKDIVTDDKRAGDVIRRLRALYERGEAKKEPLEINELIREVLQLLRSDLVSRNVAITTDLSPRLPAVLGDHVQLQQLLLNLVLNACEAMVDVKVEMRKITIRTEGADAGDVTVSVCDQGLGIALEQLEKIFEPFVTSKQLGIGLGLVIARSIVSAHGGKLWATNNRDCGATFSFTLATKTATRSLDPAVGVDIVPTAVHSGSS